MSDETKTGAEMEADRLLAHLQTQLAHATPAPEPGQAPGEVLAKTLDDGGQSLPVPVMVAARQESAGYTWVYDTETGAPSKVNNNMLRQQLRKTRLDRHGRQVEVFTTIRPDPARMPKPGAIKCLLHPEHDGRAEWAEYNFPPCYKANLVSKFALDTHMQHRHPQEWATVKEARERAEREEERLHRRAIIEMATRAQLPAKRGKALAGDDAETAA